MKRILSTIIAIVMVVSVMSFVPFTANATGDSGHTLDAHNVGFEVPYFSGSTYFYAISGAVTDPDKLVFSIDDDPINIADKSGSGELVLDGQIDEDEWGIPIIDVDSQYAAERKTTTPSAENTYFWWSQKTDTDLNGKADLINGEAVHEAGLSYKVWMAWDEDYLYIASLVNDPDYFFSTQDGSNIWNGDALQFIIDPEGPNSVSGGTGYDAGSTPFPWNYPEKKTETSNDGYIANIGAAYCQVGDNGNPCIYDLSHRYNPEKTPVLDASGNVDYYTVKWSQYDINYLNYYREFVASPNEIMRSDDGLYAYAAIQPRDLNDKYETTYELAIPWSLVSGSHYVYDEDTDECSFISVDPNPKAGDEYGFSMVLLNGARGPKNYNSWLTWGSGVCNAQTNNSADFPTAGGSNSMLLVSDELGTTGCEHTFKNPTCSEPYVCTKCGYKKGFAAGHDYVSEVVTPLAGNMDGVIKATCSYCGEEVVTTIPAVDKVERYRFNDAPSVGILSNSSDWCSGETQADWSFAYSDENGNPIFNDDGSRKCSYRLEGDGMIFDFSDGAAGTYFSNQTNQRSFSYEYDFRLTGDDYETAFGDDAYNNTTYAYGIYNWFGGAEALPGGQYRYGCSYAAGFFTETQGSTVGKFKIMQAIGGVALPSHLENGGSAPQKVFAETEEIDLGTDWHHAVFVFDEENCVALYYLDGKFIMGAWDPGMSMNGKDQVPIIRRFDMPCMFKGMGIGSTTAFLDNAAGYTVTCDGEVIGTYNEGDVVTLPTLAFNAEEGLRFFTWTGEGVSVRRSAYKAANGTANGRIYTLTMPAEDVVLTSVFTLVGDVNYDKKINTKDLTLIKKIIASAVDDPDEATSDRADLTGDDKINTRDVTLIKKVFTDTATVTQ